MKNKLLKIFKNKNNCFFVIYIVTFIFLINQDAIYTPDTYSYLRASPYRSPGYVIFVKLFKFLFNPYFNTIVVCFQLIIGILSLHLFFKTVSKLLNINIFIQFLLLFTLIYPLFSPLYVANNICSEGLSYPLYLITLNFILQWLFFNSKKAFIFLLTSFTLLTLTRGQFIIIPIILGFIYLLKERKKLLNLKHLKIICILAIIPLLPITLDKTYHKLKDDVFKTTPFNFVNAATLGFFVSKSQDSLDIKAPVYRELFSKLHKTISDKKLLSDQNNFNSDTEKYIFFHNNLVEICNHTIHKNGIDFFLARTNDYTFSLFEIEKACKNILPILMKNNLKNWIGVYFQNILHGFKFNLVFYFTIFCFITSLVLLLINYSHINALLFLFSSLILANAMIVAFACHSIDRYIFYNYPICFTLPILLIKLVKNEK